MFYIYEWYNIDTNEIFYVGKGCKKRYLSKQHNHLFKEYINTFRCSSRIIKYFETEEAAFNAEYNYIKQLKLQNLCICNIYYGGFGGETKSWTTIKRRQYSKNNVMKRNELKNRMKIDNPMFKKDIALKNGLKHRKPFYIGDIEYQTLQEASIVYKKPIQTIKYWLKCGHNKTDLCYYKNQPKPNYDFNKNSHNINGFHIMYNNTEYNSLKELANSLNLKYTTLYKYYKQNKSINGFIIKNYKQGNQQPSTNLND